MKQHRRKMIAPVIITAIIVGYYLFFFFVLMAQTGGIARIALGVVPLVLSAVMIGVCVERIKEIRNGEEDDLGKY